MVRLLDGWKMAGEGRFIVAELDATLQSVGGMGFIVVFKKIFKNFILKLEWKYLLRATIQEFLFAFLILTIIQIMLGGKVTKSDRRQGRRLLTSDRSNL
jgi:hypothetical protein